MFVSNSGQAIVSAMTSGSKRFFLGTDSAPHEKQKKECPCGCAGIYNAPVALSLYAKVFEEVISRSYCCCILFSLIICWLLYFVVLKSWILDDSELFKVVDLIF